MLKSSLSTLALSVCALTLMGCEATKEELGLNRRIPDEFAVVQRAPLEMPPDYYLRPPTPGAARPQEQTPSAQAAHAVLGAKQATRNTSRAEDLLLKKTNVAGADPDIRQKIDAETKEIAEQDKPTIQRLLNLGGKESEAPAKTIDPVAERERLKLGQ